MCHSHPPTNLPTQASANSLNLPAFDDASDAVRDLIAAVRPELLGTEQAVELREFLEHMIVATSPDQPMSIVAVHMIRQAVLSAELDANVGVGMDVGHLTTCGAP